MSQPKSGRLPECPETGSPSPPPVGWQWLACSTRSQPSISFGAGPDFTAESFAVGGIAVFHAPALASDVLFNQKSLRKSERPPDQVTATNVALMGRDIGILGATIALPLYPTGIHKFTV